MDKESLIYLFHHIHHKAGEHEVHHCGGGHRAINPKLDYEICHCQCALHRINKKIAIGHGTNQEEIEIKFMEQCPEGGWHIESGQVVK
ncbi:MAG TPA: hypothetical protein P5089_03360 [Candidatus Portnoybacteria bacterium]|nr:hypothetical protein [Candidatus Portnoybacteria bacterium]